MIEERDYDITQLPTTDPAQERREQAFNAIYAWKGKEFEGVSSSKKDLWVSMCHKAGYPPLDACFDDLTLFVPRAKALVWICLTPPKELRTLRANGMDRLIDAFEAWSDANIKSSADDREIMTLGLRIFNDSAENTAEAVPMASDAPGK